MNAIHRPYKSATHVSVSQVKQPDALPTFDVRDFMGPNTQVRFMLDDQTYFLRVTRAGKLILTK